MSYKIADFSSQLALTTKIHKWNANRAAELNAIAAALATDPTRRSAEMETGPVQILRPGHHLNTKFTNDIMLVVNAGKAGNLTPVAMGNAITAGLANEIPPVNTAAPVASGTGTVGQVLSCTTGTWTYGQTYTYQWLRGGVAITGAITANHTLVAADSGTNVSCRVTASNPAGSASATSNAIACA
jgi:hypothetical protein